jgi:class 3 adenylate cyclase
MSVFHLAAVRSNAIVSSLFPSTVRDRLFQQENDELPSLLPTRSRLKTYLDDEGASQSNVNDSRPIADLFSDTTVMFADIAGFTAWSSVHEPAQVFTLLETLYGAFDDIAVRRGVFKVETIGDSYVAVTGLPEPRADHAIVMVKFARDCRSQMDQLTRHLEKTLGPGTGDLQLRFGLHSGPTTAGVLRGQKSRFQLFGDTVNTAARMESTGIKSRIQVSEATAALIKAAGKAHWVKPRNELVMAKGKGNMQTYWIEPRAGGHDPSNSLSQGSFSGTSSVTSLSNDTNEDKIERLIEWNTDILASLVKHITARHKIMKSVKKPSKVKTEESISGSYQGDGRVLDEVKDIFEMPAFDGRNCNKQESPDLIELDTEVVSQLRDYVVTIALQYHNNPFHNFDHASHVGMSVAKLMSRIIGPDSVLERQSSSRTMNSSDGALASTLHDHTYGITSDPLTQFACVYAALIHDVDHQGVPNTQLVKENAPVAVHYKGKSVAEQNSVDIAWNLLMEPSYDALRNAICPTEEELLRFRKLVVNSVMATDIMDKDLKNLRNARWEKAFDETDIKVGGARDNVNRKATIVIEHLIQASDVAHTMQHWHVYRKWNERLFEEMYVAYKAGRAEKDPSEFWYQGELGFFDFYIIPLAKKLSECGVFGVASDEYLNYAQKNREEWEERGKEIVASMLTKLGNTDAGSAK